MHAQGHIRESFAEWVDNGCEATEVGSDFFYDGVARSTLWLFGQLWRCSDIMPAQMCYTLDMRPGSTYAQAVHALRHKVKPSVAANPLEQPERGLKAAPSKTREMRLRRVAHREGYAIHKDRARSWRLGHCGGFMIVDPSTSFPMAGFEYDLDLNAVEEWLTP
ncbi:MAG: hypothetical protein QOE83_1997 [Actinomycetota bacterium]|jgi:hypothetical protein|nr:hypothetical protein [Actinomycetota bacterium]